MTFSRTYAVDNPLGRGDTCYMSGYIGNAGDAAQELAMDAVDNGIHAIRQQMQHSYGLVSLLRCKECDEEIPEGRRLAVPGVQYCIHCQDDHMIKHNVKMLTKML